MSKRTDILDGRQAATESYGLVYTEVLGWIDLGHAQGTDIRALLTFKMLRPVSKTEALKRWDYYGKIGSFKVNDFIPLLFPEPEKFPNSQPRYGLLPPS